MLPRFPGQPLAHVSGGWLVLSIQVLQTIYLDIAHCMADDFLVINESCSDLNLPHGVAGDNPLQLKKIIESN